MSTQEHLSALPVGYRLHEYEIAAVLGVGGFGITYLATDTQLGMRVAIKEYLPNTLAVRADNSTVLPKSKTDEEGYRWGLDRFMKEAQTLARFRHPNIVRVLRFFEANGTGYTVMEYEEGESLAEYLRTHPLALREPEILTLLLPLLDGLKQVHAAGFLHRDIKPANIYLRSDGTPVLIDFGSARQAMGSHTQSLTSVFTPGYAPFEQYFADGRQGPWTDIYALGAVLYRLAAGESPPDAAKRIKDDTLTPASIRGKGRYSAGFLHAIDQALMMNEEARPQTIDAWLSLLVSTRAPAPKPAAPATHIADAPTVAIAAGQAKPVHAAAPAAAPRTQRPHTTPQKKGSPLKTLLLIVLAVILAGGVLKHIKQRKAHALAAVAAPTQPSAQEAPAAPPPAQQLTAAVKITPTRPEAPADNQGLPLTDANEGNRSAPDTANAPRSAPPQPSRSDSLSQRFTQADSNGDGYLSRDEVSAAFPRMARFFDFIDQNHDGQISEQEFRQFVERQRGREFAGRQRRYQGQ